MNKKEERLLVLNRIYTLEKSGDFNTDVEDDAPAKTIKPKDVDYLNKKLSSRFLTNIANKLGTMFFEKMIKDKKFIIKDIVGIENFATVSGGAIITCNHFNLRDNYAVYKAIKPALSKNQKLYKIIKESNYTNFKGPVRLMMRHANTLPLSSSFETMKEFSRAIKTLLARGEKILIYPEQAMWWNYKKPRPFKPGAFKIAVKNNVPVIPIFITMTNSDVLDDDGFFVQEYYIHILPAIYPAESLTPSENEKMMSDLNYKAWVDVYKNFYNTKLEFLKD